MTRGLTPAEVADWIVERGADLPRYASHYQRVRLHEVAERVRREWSLPGLVSALWPLRDEPWVYDACTMLHQWGKAQPGWVANNWHREPERYYPGILIGVLP